METVRPRLWRGRAACGMPQLSCPVAACKAGPRKNQTPGETQWTCPFVSAYQAQGSGGGKNPPQLESSSGGGRVGIQADGRRVTPDIRSRGLEGLRNSIPKEGVRLASPNYYVSSSGGFPLIRLS